MKKIILTFMLVTLMATTALTNDVEAATKKVKVTYVENGGKEVEDQTVNKNSNPKEPKTTRTGYSFSGWHTNKSLTKKWNEKSSKVTKNTTLYAKWTKKKYTVTYNSGSWNVKTPSTKVSYGTNLKEPKPKKTGCVFMGWYTDKALTKAWDTKNGKVTKNMTLYGKWDYEVKASDFEIRSDGMLIAYRGKAENVTVPSTVTKIDEYSFRNSVKHVTLPNTVTSIAECAFDPQHSKLTTINIPSSVKDIGDNAFGRNNPILKITNNSNAVKWAYKNGYRHTINGGSIIEGAPYKIEDGVFLGYYAYDGNLVIPDGVTTIGYHAFYFNNNINSITFPTSVKTIEREAFYFAKNLTSITIPEGSVERIEPYAFSYTGLKTVNIPSTVKYISDVGFAYISPTFKITNNDYVANWAKFNGYNYYHNGVYYGKSSTSKKAAASTLTSIEETVEDNEEASDSVENVVEDTETTEEAEQSNETTNNDTTNVDSE